MRLRKQMDIEEITGSGWGKAAYFEFRNEPNQRANSQGKE